MADPDPDGVEESHDNNIRGLSQAVTSYPEKWR